MSIIQIDETVMDVLGMSREELGALDVDAMIELVLLRGYDIEITVRHSFDHGRMRLMMADPRDHSLPTPATDQP